MKTYSIKISSSLPQSFLEDILITAFEGGINYWCDFMDTAPSPESVDIYKVLFQVKGSSILLHVDDEDADKMEELTLPRLLKGISSYCVHAGITPNRMEDEIDADMADMIIQFAIFNQLVFG